MISTSQRVGSSMMSRRFLASVVPTCPPPRYDTGCTYCAVPSFPANKQIDYSTNLNGTTTIPWKHLMILSHGVKSFKEMPSKIEMIPESLSMHITQVRRRLFSAEHPVVVSNIIMKNQEEFVRGVSAGEELVYLYPDRKIIRFKSSDAVEFVKKYLVPKEAPAEVYNPFKRQQKVVEAEESGSYDSKLDYKFEETDVDKGLVLICGHGQRDVRCGELGPLLEDEFAAVISREIKDKVVEVGMVSHIGGHAYAGNVIYLPEEANQEIVWYGRVFPEKVQGIVSETIIGGRIIRELYRGELTGN